MAGDSEDNRIARYSYDQAWQNARFRGLSGRGGRFPPVIPVILFLRLFSISVRRAPGMSLGTWRGALPRNDISVCCRICIILAGRKIDSLVDADRLVSH